MRKMLIVLACCVPALYLSAQFPEKNVKDAFIISRMVEKFHIQPRTLDDEMSSAILTRILEELDDQRIFFTQEDIKKLTIFRFRLDEEIQNRQSAFLQLLAGIYKQRLIVADTMIDHICAKSFPISLREKLTLAEDSSYPADLAAMHGKMYKLLKFFVLRSIANTIVLKGKEPSKKLTDSLEPVLRKKASVIIKRSIKRVLQSPLGIDNTIGILYCQALASCYDPHTAYFPPDEKAAFETLLGNKPLSYGLALSEDDDGIPRIGHLQPGGPAFQSGALNEGDQILSIQWDEKEPIDVSNAALAEIDAIVAAEGGSKLTVNVKKADGTTRQASLYKQRLAGGEEEDRVKGFLLKGARTAGYISLPAFYTDWENNTGINGCANDVAKEVLKLKKENIEGLILDLRYNGGGSVEEAVALSGIFIDAGPVAQIKTRSSKVITLKDINRGTIYDGPLLILVNGNSASASEMVAGTLQDYHRALIAGSPTYGKATAQVVLPMDTTIDPESGQGQAAAAASYIKLTTSKLYRINGTSAQISGVRPDILLPEPPDALLRREADEKFALSSSVIEANKYYTALPPLPVAAVQSVAAKMLETDSFFREATHPSAAIIKNPIGRKDIDLDLDDVLQERKLESGLGAGGNAGGNTAGSATTPTAKPAGNSFFVVMNHAYENRRLQADHELQEINEERKKGLANDPYVRAAYLLVTAMIK